MTVLLTAECAEVLAHYCRAWRQHGVRFGITGAHRRLENYDTIFTAWCGTPESMGQGVEEGEMEQVLLLAGDPLVYRFPHGHPEHERRGRVNPRFLDAAAMQERYAGAFTAAARNTTLLLSVAHLYPTEGVAPAMFVGRLALFLDALPSGRRYAVEVQNGELLVPEYFEMLRERNVVRVIGGGADMPLLDQVLMPAFMNDGRVIARIRGQQGPAIAMGVRELVRRSGDRERSTTILLEDLTEVALMTFAGLMEWLNGELSRRSVIRKRAA